MPFNINTFMANLNRGGLAKTANFEVMVHRPFGSNVNQERDLQFRCTSCTIPGRRVDTTETTDFSLPKSIGYMTTLDDVNMRILLSEDMREKTYFDEWLDAIVGSYRLGQINKSMFDLGFYDD